MCYSSGAMRGVYYAGVMHALDEAGIAFAEFSGVSVGSTAAAWHAAGQAREAMDAWEALGPFQISHHPLFNNASRKNLDWLIYHVTLPFLDLNALKKSDTRLHVALTEVVAPWKGGKGWSKRAYLPFKGAFASKDLFDAVRASCYMPFINGVLSTYKIRDKHYLDGGLTGRIPIDCINPEEFDEIWIAAASPRALVELEAIDLGKYAKVRPITITPSKDIPLGTIKTNIRGFRDTALLGYHDTQRVLERYCK